MSKVLTNVDLYVLTRTQTLFGTISEIVEGVTGQPAPNTIRKGVLDEPLLSAVVIYVVNKEQKILAKVELQIDWEKHRLYSSAAGMNRLHFEPDRSVSEQISRAIGEISRFISSLRSSEGAKAEVWYRVRLDGPVGVTEARKRLGFDPEGSEQLEWAEGKYLRGKFTPDRLDELQIDFRTKVE